MVFLAAPMTGWLADVQFGNYKVFRTGVVLLFISSVLNCLMKVLEAIFWEDSQVLEWIHVSISGTFFGNWCCYVYCYITASWSGSDA